MSAGVYANAKLLMATDNLQWVDSSQVFRALLVTSAYTFNHTATYVADIAAFEVSGGTYARSDVQGRTATLDLVGDRAILDAYNPVFPALSGVTPAGMVIYKQVGGDDTTPGDDPLICFVGFPLSSTNGTNFMVEFDPVGVIALTAC